MAKLTAALGAALALAALAAPALSGALETPAALVKIEVPATDQWSAPAVLSTCAADIAPQVAFPSDSPTHATGSGAIVWSASAGCHGTPGARIAELGQGDRPGRSGTPRTGDGAPFALRGPLAISGAPHGEIAIAGAAPDGSGGLLIEGAAGGPFAALESTDTATAPIALATAYQGDLALASDEARPRGLRVHVQRRFAVGFDRSTAITAARGPSAQTVAVALDFRSDALAVWTEDGGLYAHDLPASGRAHPIERIATVAAHTTIATLLSDDNRAIVAWVEQSGEETSVFVDQSGTGVRFSGPRLLERFVDPDGLRSPATSPRLVRLSSESVMLAWSGAAAGHWVVHTAAIDQRGLQVIGTIATPGVDALLADLAPGPLAEALVMWTEPQPGGTREAIFTARGTESAPGRTFFGEPEVLAPAGANSDPRLAFDPSSDRALAVWRGPNATIDYAIRAGDPRS